MGIPFLFGVLLKKNANIITNEIPKCSKLYLDFNAIIHTASATVVNRIIEYKNQDIFDEIIKYTLMICNICQPKDLLYIAVDGVAPRSKIMQQRRRRYISAYRNDCINNFKKKNNITISKWDSNCITPGTEFMIELDTYLKIYFSNNKFNFSVIISGHEEPSEGEHKIIKYIKENKSNFGDIILGLDADLIMLSLGCQNAQIYLMRENIEFNESNQHVYFKFLDINILRKDVAKHLYDNDCEGYMYDYIFISFLLGNDFIPAMSFLKLKDGALDIIIDVYKKIYKELNEYIIIKNDKGVFNVNQKFLIKMFEQFANMEDICMKEAIIQYDNIEFNSYKKFKTKLDRYIYEYENMPLINKSSTNIINPHNNPNWRINYYHHLFGSMSTVLMKESAIKYIESLIWNTNYYFNMNFDKSWYYEYNYSPCVSDLYKYLYTMEHEYFIKLQKKLSIDNSHIIDSTMQMLMVLPPQSKNLLSNKMQALYTSIDLGCVHFFPSKFIFSTFLKTQTWECIPILPLVNILQLQKGIIDVNKS